MRCQRGKKQCVVRDTYLHVIFGTAIASLEDTPEFPCIAAVYHFPRVLTARDAMLVSPKVADCVRQGIRRSY